MTALLAKLGKYEKVTALAGSMTTHLRPRRAPARAPPRRICMRCRCR